jgi:hypothetical protein
MHFKWSYVNPAVMIKIGRTYSSDINSLYEYVGAYLESFLLIELTASVALCCWHGTSTAQRQWLCVVDMARQQHGVSGVVLLTWHVNTSRCSEADTRTIFHFYLPSRAEGSTVEGTDTGFFRNVTKPANDTASHFRILNPQSCGIFWRKKRRWGCPETEWRGKCIT